MSFCFINLFVTIWCKDNKLIIYLSMKKEMQKIQNTALRKIMSAFKSSLVKVMQSDANILDK
jgi:hypothetical protein